MPDRKLATLETITALSPIPDADAIETAAVRGWDVVVRKGEFAVGDAVVYFEIDSALPLADERFTFLGARSTKTLIAPDGVVTEVHVLKTARLRGQYSQGLVMPADAFATEIAKVTDPATGELNADLAEAIGVTKWEPPLPAGSHALGAFPSYLRKTDAERVQNIDAVTWAEIRAIEDVTPGTWVPVEKIDGSSYTAWRTHDGVLHIAARGIELDPAHANAHFEATARERISVLLEPGEFIQAEVAGPGLQKNPLGLDRIRLFVFTYGRHTSGEAANAADADAFGTRMPYEKWPTWARDLAAPVYDFTLPATIAETVKQVETLTSLVTPGKGAEGVVWTHRDGLGLRRLDDRHVWKSISSRYLMKHS